MKILKATLGIFLLMFVIMFVQAYWEGSHFHTPPTYQRNTICDGKPPGCDPIDEEIKQSIEINKY